MDLHGDALKRIMGDMDDMESKRMFPPKTDGGATITISVQPGGDTDGDEDEYPEGHDESLCKGGCAYHKGGMTMADGGVVESPAIPDPEGDLGLPPFLRKKRSM